MTPEGTSETLGDAPRFAGQSLHTSGAFPLSQLQPASSTMLARNVVKLRLHGVSRRAVPLFTSATQSADPAGVVAMKATSFPSRDQSRSTNLPDNPGPLTRPTRPLAKSTSPPATVPL